MAKCRIIHACGHKAFYYISGSPHYRTAQKEKRRLRPCNKCLHEKEISGGAGDANEDQAKA